MTLLSESPQTHLAPAPAAPARADSFAALRRLRAGDVAVLAAGIWWALPLTHAVGGRNAKDEGVLLALLTLAAALVKPWKRLPTPAVALPVCVAAAALLIPALAPTGWRGADDAAGYACAAMAFLVAAGWAGTTARRLALAGAIALAGLDEVCNALLPWWGGGDPSAELSGSFFWHNPFAAFLLPSAVLGMAFVTWRIRPAHLIGWITTPLCTAGIVYSSSRATLSVEVVAIAGVGVLALRGAERVTRLLRLAALTAVSVGLTFGLTGPPLFSHWVSPFASSAARSARGETLATNGGYRLQFWHSALDTLTHHPLVGSGFHGLIEAGKPLTPGGWARSNYAHNGYLQALSDGGLLLGLPVIIGSLLLGWLALRTLLRGLRTGQADPLLTVASLGLLAALAHSGVDFDWSHSALFVMDALVGALLVAGVTTPRQAPAPAGPSASPGPRLGSRLVAVMVVGLSLLGAGMGAIGIRSVSISTDSSFAGPSLAAHYAQLESRPFAGDIAARDLLQLAANQPTAVTDDQRRTAIRLTAREATIDLDLASVRAEAALRLGDRATARALVVRLRAVEATRPAFATDLAPLLAAMGQRAQAEQVLLGPATDALNTNDTAAIGSWSVAYARVQGAASPAAACLRQALVTPHSCDPQVLAAP